MLYYINIILKNLKKQPMGQSFRAFCRSIYSAKFAIVNLNFPAQFDSKVSLVSRYQQHFVPIYSQCCPQTKNHSPIKITTLFSLEFVNAVCTYLFILNTAKIYFHSLTM